MSRYFDRIVHPSQLLTALPRAVLTLTDPALCGPVTLALPQDVQADAFDYPAEFFETPVVEFRAVPPNEIELAAATRAVIAAKRPVIIAGGGVLYGGACGALREFSERHGVPVCETQAGKSSLAWDHPLQLGPVGRDWIHRCQCSHQRSGLDPRCGHPSSRLHDRVELAVPEGKTRLAECKSL